MQIGIHLPQYWRVASPDAITVAARAAEDLGFADVWVSDHVAQPGSQGYPSPYLFDPFMTLAWAGAATETVGLGTSVLVAPQYHPLWLANTTATLDVLTGGRLKLAVGVGWSEAEFEALGQDFHTRGRRTDEIIELMRACWETDPTTYAGEHYRLEDYRVLPKPGHPIEIWIGGSAEASYRRAAKYGSGFQLIGLKPDTVVEPIDRLRRDNPDPASFTISLRTGWDPLGMDPAEIADEYDGFAAAGVQHMVCAPWRKDLDDWLTAMQRLAEIVIR